MYTKFITAVLTGIALLAGNLSAQNIYNNPDKKYTVTFPADWIQKPASSGYDAMYLAPPDPFDNSTKATASILSTAVPASTTLDQIVDANVTDLNKLEDFNLEGSTTVNLNGANAKVLQYSYQASDGNPYTVRQYFLMNGNATYLLTFTALPDSFGQYSPTFFSIANSFQFQ